METKKSSLGKKTKILLKSLSSSTHYSLSTEVECIFIARGGIDAHHCFYEYNYKL